MVALPAPRAIVAGMGLLHRRESESRQWPKPGAGARVMSPGLRRGRRGRVRELQRALELLRQLEDDPSVEVIEVQPVAQLCGGAGYLAWRDGVERAWRRQKGGRLSTASWPRTLGTDHVAVLLLPLPAGRVGPAARNARPIADPVFSSGVPLVDAPGTDPVLELLLTWMQNPGKGHTARLAPPVIETIVHGKVAERWVETFGLEWPLPPADGL
jgi:hypothetical protein